MRGLRGAEGRRTTPPKAGRVASWRSSPVGGGRWAVEGEGGREAGQRIGPCRRSSPVGGRPRGQPEGAAPGLGCCPRVGERGPRAGRAHPSTHHTPHTHTHTHTHMQSYIISQAHVHEPRCRVRPNTAVGGQWPGPRLCPWGCVLGANIVGDGVALGEGWGGNDTLVRAFSLFFSFPFFLLFPFFSSWFDFSSPGA